MRRAGLLEMLKHQSISSGHGPFGDGAAAAAAANAASGGGKLACSTPLSCGETLSSFSATPFMMTSPRAQRSLPMASVPRSQKRHSMQLALQVSSCSGSGGDDGTRAAATGRIGPGRLRLFAGLSANTAACRAGASVSPPQLPPTLSPSCSSVRSALHFDSADCAAPATDAPHGPPAASRRRQPGRLALRGVHVGPCHSHEHAAYDASTGLAARTCLALECDNGGRDGRVEEPVCFAASESRTVGSLMPAGWPQSEGQGYEDATLAMPWAPEQQHWQQQEQQQQQQPLLPYTDPAAGGPVCCGAASTAATGCDVDGSDADEDEWEWLLSKIPDPPPAQGSVADNLLGAFAAEYAGRNGAGDGARATVGAHARKNARNQRGGGPGRR